VINWKQIIIGILIVLVTLLEIIFKNSQLNYLIGIQFVNVITLILIAKENYRGAVIYLVSASILVELFLYQTLGISLLTFAVTMLVIDFSTTKLVDLKLGDNRFLISVFVLILNPFLNKIVINLIDGQKITISIIAIILSIIMFYFGIFIVGIGTNSNGYKSKKRIDVY